MFGTVILEKASVTIRNLAMQVEAERRSINDSVSSGTYERGFSMRLAVLDAKKAAYEDALEAIESAG